MKRKSVYYTISVFVVIIFGFTFFVTKPRHSGVHDHFTRLPESKQHQHFSPDGDVDSHIHIYDKPEQDKFSMSPSIKLHDTAATQGETKHQIQKVWEKLDLSTIKRNLQPYTVAKMNEMWWDQELGIHWQKHHGWIEDIYPCDEWLQRCLDLGYPLLTGYNYRTALRQRSRLNNQQKEFDNLEPLHPKDPGFTGRTSVLSELGIPADTAITWEEYEDLFLKSQVIAANILEQEYRTNPDYIGGSVSATGVFTAFHKDSAHVHLDPNTGYVRVIGAKLTDKEREDLIMFGIIPKGMHIVYRDKDGNPLPDDVSKPRYFEKRMAELEQAEKQIEKLVSAHDELFNQPKNETIQVTRPNVADTQQDHSHPHEEVGVPKDTAKKSNVQRKIPSQVGKNRHPPQPPEPPSPEQVKKWFEELILLHGGDLPKDLKALQEVIKELEAIRKIGRKMVPQRSPLPPERPTPPNNKSSEQ